jgi:hypothetical protein
MSDALILYWTTRCQLMGMGDSRNVGTPLVGVRGGVLWVSVGLARGDPLYDARCV